MKDRNIQYCRAGKKICLPPSKTLWDMLFRKATISDIFGDSISIVVLSRQAWDAVSHYGCSWIKIKSDYSQISLKHENW